MNIAIGLTFIAVTVIMMLVARPRDGVSAPFLRIWIVGQVYVLVALVSAVLGAAAIISSF
jgi:hypothetical protein